MNPDSAGAELDALDDFLVEVETLRADSPEAALQRLGNAAPELRDRPESRLLGADLAWETRGVEAAREQLERLVADVPDYADARYLLGCCYEELERDDERIEQFLEVHRLDAGLDAALGEQEATELEELIADAAEATLAELPEPFRERMAGVPILVEPRPSEQLVREGFDPRALGLFEGPTDAERANAEITTTPTRISLFTANLLAEAVDEEQLRAEVETTVLHELGHYFGLEEADMERLGLD
jgi:predicted Zn-dependent protease with MMP-like domain